jgi:replicative DNA helicase
MDDLKAKEIFCRPTDERAVIAYCMKDITNYFTVCSKLTASDFLYSQHEMLMLTFEALAAKGAEKFEVNLIVSEASSGGFLANIGGLKYIKTISNMKLSASNFNLYLEAVCESATKYKLFRSLNEKIDIIKKNAKDGLSGLDLLSNVEADLLELSMSGFSLSEPIDLGNDLMSYIDYLKENKVELSGLSTGYPILDKQIDGLVPGTLQVIAARKKKGKSTFLTNVALHIAYRLGTPVLYVDTELSFKEWRSRALSTISGIKERDIKHGGFDDITYGRLRKAVRLIDESKGKLFHEYMPGYSVDKLVALYKKYKQKEKIGLILFDYLKEPDSSSVDRQRKEYQVLGDVTTKLKDLAGQLDIPALTAVQLNRSNDIADSDRIARYADVIAFWSDRDPEEIEEGGYDCGTHKLVIKDTRRGGATSETGIGYMFFKDHLKIREVPIDKQYFSNFEKIVNADSAADSGDFEDSEELL